MARDWRDLFILDGATGARARAASRRPRSGAAACFRRLRESLRKTRQALQTEIQATLFEDLNDETWERLEEALIYADVGARTTAAGRRPARARGDARRSSRAARRCRIAWSSCWPRSPRAGDDRDRPAPKPTVILVAGRQRDRQDDDDRQARLAPEPRARTSRCVGAAGHVPRRRRRAARACGRSAPACEFVKGAPDADPGLGRLRRDRRSAIRDGADVVIIDTAGRLHTQDDLMAELAKVRRVIAKQIPEAPARDAADRRRDHRARTACARRSCSPRRSTVDRDRADQARRHRQGRDRAGDRPRAGHPGQADRGRRAARGPAPVRRRRVRPRAGVLSRARQIGPPGDTAVALISLRMAVWIFWVIVACAFGIGEMLTTELLPGPVRDRRGAGGGRPTPPSARAARLGRCSSSSSLLTLVLRAPDRRARTGSMPPQIRTGAAALVGKQAIVLERIANDEGVGCVKIDGEVWTARSLHDDEVIERGTRVEVVDIKGATALVTRMRRLAMAGADRRASSWWSFLVILFARTVRIVPQARAGIVERFGRYHRTLNAGADDADAVHRPAQAADRPARAGRLVPAAAGDHRGQPRGRRSTPSSTSRSTTPSRVDLRGRQPAAGDRADHRHHAAQRDRLADARGRR